MIINSIACAEKMLNLGHVYINGQDSRPDIDPDLKIGLRLSLED